jgi:enamine deaminase RidA (YjgF/YER057c/UK114 family)
MTAIRHVDVPGYPAAHSPYSHAVVANGFVFVSGQIAVRPGCGPSEIIGTTMAEQTRQCLRNVETVLRCCGRAEPFKERRHFSCLYLGYPRL